MPKSGGTNSRLRRRSGPRLHRPGRSLANRPQLLPERKFRQPEYLPALSLHPGWQSARFMPGARPHKRSLGVFPPFRPGRLNHPRRASERFLYASRALPPVAEAHRRQPSPVIPVSQSSQTVTLPEGRTPPVGDQPDPLAGLFPLPMGPYEQYMLLDDSAAYPMTFLMAIEVSGDLQ